MKTLKEFLEAKLKEHNFLGVQWRREGDVVYVSYLSHDHGVRVDMTLSELVDELFWQESGV